MSDSDKSGKTPNRPADPGDAWTFDKLVLVGVVTLGTALAIIYFVSPFPH